MTNVNVSFSIANTVNYTEVPGYELDPGTDEFPPIYGNIEFGFTVNFSVDDEEEGTYEVVNITTLSAPNYITATDGVNSVRLERNTNEEIFPGEEFHFVKYGYNEVGDELIVANTSIFPDFPEDPNDTSADANTTPSANIEIGTANTEPAANTSFETANLEFIDLTTSIFPDDETEYGLFESYVPSQTDNADSETSVYAWITPPIFMVTGSFSFEITYVETTTLIAETVVFETTQDYHWNWVPGIQELTGLVQRSRY